MFSVQLRLSNQKLSSHCVIDAFKFEKTLLFTNKYGIIQTNEHHGGCIDEIKERV